MVLSGCIGKSTSLVRRAGRVCDDRNLGPEMSTRCFLCDRATVLVVDLESALLSSRNAACMFAAVCFECKKRNAMCGNAMQLANVVYCRRRS